MNQDVVGQTAGEVWNFLKKNGKVNMSQLEKAIRQPKSIQHMALGWLAREGKISFHEDRRSTLIELND